MSTETRYENTQTEERWEIVLPDGTTWSHTSEGLAHAIDHERRSREFFTVMYAELVANGTDDDLCAPPAPAREIVHTRITRTTVTTITVETLDRHLIDHSRTDA